MYQRKHYFFALFLVCLVCNLWAGDVATFVDLGFSPDGKAYMFAQYGIQSQTLKPWADLYVVDVNRNVFVPGGRISYVHTGPVVAGQDGSGALYRLIAKNAALADQHRVDFLIQGQPLYVSLNHDGLNNETIEFRDFESGASYKAVLNSFVEGTGANLRSSFYISVDKTSANGSRSSYIVGTPDIKRPLITSYRIRKVMIAPKDGSMIFAVEMRKQSGSTFDIRYMVEALRL